MKTHPPNNREGTMSSTDLLTLAYKWGPVLFGIGFIAPLVAQSLDAAGVSTAFGLSGPQIGLSAGFVAKLRGSWV